MIFVVRVPREPPIARFLRPAFCANPCWRIRDGSVDQAYSKSGSPANPSPTAPEHSGAKQLGPLVASSHRYST